MEENKVIEISEFSWKEFQRLINMIPQTDPTSPSYGTLLESIERYGAIYSFVDWALSMQVKEPGDEPIPDNIVPFAPPTAEEEKFPEPVEETPEPAEQIDPAVVKSLITKARSEKKISSVKDWLQANWGVDGFSAVPAAKYPEVLAKLKEIGVE